MEIKTTLDDIASFLVDPSNHKHNSQGAAWLATIILGIGTVGVAQILSGLWRMGRQVQDKNETQEKISQFVQNIFYTISPLQKVAQHANENNDALWENNFAEMESRYSQLKIIARSLTTPTIQIPEIVYTKDEDEAWKSLPKIQAVETYLKNTYGNELEDQEFHGRLSHQRIIWQDEKFIALLQDLETVKAIFFYAYHKTEKPLTTSGYTLSSMILYGLSSNLLSYLLKATPNWKTTKFSPHEMTRDFLQSVQKGLDNITKVLLSATPLTEIEIPSDEYLKIEKLLVTSSSHQLYNAIVLYVKDKQRAQDIVKGVSKATGLEAMNRQCLAGMQDFQDYADWKGLVLALNLDIYSHLLDAKHLAAAIAHFDDPAGLSDQELEGQKLLKTLLQKTFDESIEQEACELMKSKLQQILLLIIEKCRETKNETMLSLISETLEKRK